MLNTSSDDVDVKIIYGTAKRESYHTDLVSLAAYVYVIYKYLMLVFGVCSGQMEH